MLKKEEEEGANVQERLFDSSENKNNENENKNDEDKTVEKKVDEELNKKELFEEDDGSDTSEKVEEEIKEKQIGNPNEPNTPNDDLNGSTVEIVQPADLKPKHLGFTRTLLLAMFAAMIGTGAQFGYALGVMNAPSEVIIRIFVAESN
jgi:hypothetical protein